MTMTERGMRVKAATEALLKAFGEKNFPETLAESVIRGFGGKQFPSDGWSLRNRIISVLHGSTAAGGRKALEELGFNLSSWAQPFDILAPVMDSRRFWDEDQGCWVSARVVVGFKAVQVYRLDDCKDFKKTLSEKCRPDKLPPLVDLASEFGISEVSWGPASATSRGWFSPITGEVYLGSHDVRTWFHELAHAVHKLLVDERDGDGSFAESCLDKTSYNMAEVVAESVSACLCIIYGYDGWLWKSHAYVTGFSKGDPVAALMNVLGDVEAILMRILTAAGGVHVEKPVLKPEEKETAPEVEAGAPETPEVPEAPAHIESGLEDILEAMPW